MSSLFIVTADNRKWWAQAGVRVLKLVEGTDFSHISLAFRINDEVRIAESVFPRFRFSIFSEWARDYRPVSVYSVSVTDEQFSKILAYAAAHESKPYSLLQIANIALKRALPIFGRGLNHEGSLICSEFIARALGRALPIPHVDDYDSVGLLEVQRIIDALVTMGLAKRESRDLWLE
ncbi:MAG: hypothetical protein WHU54_09770 [Candidatus Bathyarchaeia archaeon]